MAKPDAQGISRWVRSSEFIGRYADLQLGNGGSWCRASSTLAKTYNVEFDKSLTPGYSIDAVRLNGFKKEDSFSQASRKVIRMAAKKTGGYQIRRRRDLTISSLYAKPPMM